MPDLNEEIRKLKEEGESLRKIAAALGISHEAVRKRLKAVNDKNQVSTNLEYQKLTASTIKEEMVSTGSKPRKSRASEELGDTVNLRQTSTDTGKSVNPSGNYSRGPLLGKKGVSQGVDLESGDLFKEIKDFLEAKGVEVYRMHVEPEAYQMKCDNQTITFYVKRKIMENPSPPGRVRGG